MLQTMCSRELVRGEKTIMSLCRIFCTLLNTIVLHTVNVRTICTFSCRDHLVFFFWRASAARRRGLIHLKFVRRKNCTSTTPTSQKNY